VAARETPSINFALMRELYGKAMRL
jgi:hypothetical protein